ncbi:MAG: nitroreductase family deazaflavin-dependent oxidoreductase [Pseudonocardia sp.]|nr:nitroreductase family deazaflavin-dependent oxidoreductase [Pseudonocardia sp.]
MSRTPSFQVVPRRPGDPAPDLTDYRVVHRAMTVDLDRLAVAAAELVDRHDARRLTALRYYLRCVSHEIESHHHVEDEHVWPFLVGIAGEHTALVRLSDDHDRLDPLMHRAGELAGMDRATPELAAVLREIHALLVRHIADEERDVFPIIEQNVRVADYQELQKRFRANLNPRLLPFLAPWAVRHATPDERRAMIAEGGALIRVLLALFEPRFRAREELLFGPAGLSTKDRRTVRLMKVVAATHKAVLRASGNRVGRHWFGGSDVALLTVTGRRSGRRFTVPLMGLADGADVVVAASQGGVDREPQWWLNLQADPRAEVVFRRERFEVTAALVDDSERPRLWERFVAHYAGFEDYQAGVRRQIAVVRLRRTR